VTPMQIDWCLAFWTSAEPEKHLGAHHFESDAGNRVLDWMKEEGLIDEERKPTARLGAFVEHLCEQPLPEMVWVVPARPTAPEGE